MKRAFLVTKPYLLNELKVKYEAEHFFCVRDGVLKFSNTLGKYFENNLIKTEQVVNSDKYLNIISKVKSSTFHGNDALLHHFNGTPVILLEEVSDNLVRVIEKSIEITNNKKLTLTKMILGNPLKIIIEGCDFAGKTTLAKKLANDGLLVQERNLEGFSFYIREWFDIETIRNTIKRNVEQQEYIHVVITLSDEVLEERMKSRAFLSEWDKMAKKSNEIYRNLKIESPKIKYIHIENNKQDAYEEFKKLVKGDDF